MLLRLLPQRGMFMDVGVGISSEMCTVRYAQRVQPTDQPRSAAPGDSCLQPGRRCLPTLVARSMVLVASLARGRAKENLVSLHEGFRVLLIGGPSAGDSTWSEVLVLART